MTASDYRHITVLLDEAVEQLALCADGCYVDGTFGRGGHSRLILEGLGAHGRHRGTQNRIGRRGAGAFPPARLTGDDKDIMYLTQRETTICVR